MPEFILNTENAPATYESLNAFAKGFIEALFFTEIGHVSAEEFFTEDHQEAMREGTADGNVPMCAGVADLTPEAIERVRVFCKEFEEKNFDLLVQAISDSADYDWQRAGNDLYYTHVGHGVGFWSRDLGEVGELLTKAAQYGECYLFAEGNAESYTVGIDCL